MTEEKTEDVCECEKPEKGYVRNIKSDGDISDDSTVIAYCKNCDKPIVSAGD